MARYNYWALLLILLALPVPAWAQEAEQNVPPWLQGVEASITGFYVIGEVGGVDAFTTITPITGAGIINESHSLDLNNPDLEGGGFRASLKGVFIGNWFTGLDYTAYFIDERSSLGNAGVDGDNVYAGLLDRTLIDVCCDFDKFDEGIVDFASEDVSIEQHFVDLTFGRRSKLMSGFSSFWHVGLRIAHVDFERDVFYSDFNGANTSTATIDIDSEMWGVGPTVGTGAAVHIFDGLVLRGSATASLLFSDFDLKRRDAGFNGVVNDTEIREISIDSQNVVPVFDASIELKQHFGQYYFGLGYTISAWLGGSRQIMTNGWEDSDDAYTTYYVSRDDIITHAFYARGGMVFGADGNLPTDLPEGPAIFNGLTNIEMDVAGLYVMTNYGGDPAFGSLTPIVGGGLITDSHSLDMNEEDLRGGGIRGTLKGEFANNWFAGLQYTGFFVDERSSLGDAATDNNSVHASLLDRSAADSVGLVFSTRQGIVDFASDKIELDQHFIDLSFGKKSTPLAGITSFWQLGVRAAHTDLERDVLYIQNGPLARGTSLTNLRSEFWGVGPTIGTGTSMQIFDGLVLKSTTSASVLYGDFDLQRRDTLFEEVANLTHIRDVNIDRQGIVPVIDGSLELTQSFGQFYFGLGYTVSAWLGGSRQIVANGADDVEDDTTEYRITRDDIITHAFYARGGVKFGGTVDAPEGEALFSGLDNQLVSFTGLYLMGEYGGVPAFGARTAIAGAGIDPNSFSVDTKNLDLQGGGIKVAFGGTLSDDWFGGIAYTGFRVDERSSLGDGSAANNSVTPILLDGYLADETNVDAALQNGIADFASDEISVDQHFVDLKVGQQGAVISALNGYWYSGLRIAFSEVDRNVLYVGNGDTAQIDLQSEMWGTGPTIGFGANMTIMDGMVLSGSASATLLYGQFDLERRDVYTQTGVQSGIRSVELEQYAAVPILDAEIGLTQQFGQFYFSAGYTISAWLGGARQINTAGRDDIMGDTSAYTVSRDDVITHGIYARGGMKFGGP